MKKFFFLCLSCVLFACDSSKEGNLQVIKNDLRAPAYPLIAIDPYTSAWSMSDNLYDDNVKHWTAREFPLIGAIRVDGQVYRFMGIESVKMKPVASLAERNGWMGKYTNSKPAQGWEKPDFNDTAWQTAEAAFGTENYPTVKTKWLVPDIWLRRDVDIKEDLTGRKIYLEYSHDDDAEIYINGIQVVNTGNSANRNVLLELPQEVLKTLKPGKTVIAGHCLNTGGEAILDFGLYEQGDFKPVLANAAVQKSADVQATQTYYIFQCGEVELKLSFLSPLLMDNLELISRPVNYISYDVTSADGKEHDVQIYFETAPDWALHHNYQHSRAEGYEKEGLMFLKTGNTEQEILGRKGDDIRIDWGYFFLCGEKENSTCQIGADSDLRNQFINEGKLNGDLTVKDNSYMAISRSLGKNKSASGKIMIGYDDIYSIQYFGTNLRPYWNKTGTKTIEQAFTEANSQYTGLRKKCTEFDLDLMKKATNDGGKKYADLCALAYRQSISAHKLVEAPNGDILFLSKENFSNGSIGTVDITYPSAPLYLYYNVDLCKGLLNHIFYYSESGKWTKPFPSHDIGTYPIANGQTYGDDMPIEEAGNMLTLTAAVAAVEGNADYAKKHWDVLTVWTDYLVENGLDPENQLCTDDFAGHFAHNVNLSVKAIMGIASYGYLADKLGYKDIAEKYTAKAREMAQQWMNMADDGDHYRLTFDKPGTWSQKYNLIWNKVLKLDIFPETVIDKEIAYYLGKQNEYGLPLDSRRGYTKADWIIWTATLTKDMETFEKFIDPLYKFMNETVDRIPMSDWYNTDNKHHVGFRARSVVGGYYMKMLDNKMNKR